MATFFRVPLPTGDTPSTTQRTTLGGISFRFDFRWNVRSQIWMFDLYDSTESPVVLGRCIVANYDMLKYVSSENKPKGRLFVVSNDDTDPGLYSLSTMPMYFSPEED